MSMSDGAGEAVGRGCSVWTLRVLKPESVQKVQYGDFHVLGLME